MSQQEMTMELETIQSFLDQGYELSVKNYEVAGETRYHALVWLRRDPVTSHNFSDTSMKEALQGLERYLKSREPPEGIG